MLMFLSFRPKPYVCLLYFALLSITDRLAAQTFINTVAGGGIANGVPATQVGIGYPQAIAKDVFGNLYIVSEGQNRVFKVTPGGILTVVAGNGSAGYGGDGGAAISASLNSPQDIAVDPAGNIFVADTGNNRVRKISTGIITTVAGTGEYALSNDGGPATGAALRPVGLALDGSGNLYVSDNISYRIRRVNNGIIYTFAGGASFFPHSPDGALALTAFLYDPRRIALGNDGTVYFGEGGNCQIRFVKNGVLGTVAGSDCSGSSGDDGPARSVGIYAYFGLAVDSSGNVYIGDYRRVRKVTNGNITTIAGNGSYVYAGDGSSALNTGLIAQGLLVDSAGIYIAGEADSLVWIITNGVITTVAGNGTLSGTDSDVATGANLSGPGSVAVDSSGNLFIGDSNNALIRKVTNGRISDVSVYHPGCGSVCGNEIALDSAGRLYFVDQPYVRMIANGVVSTVAGDGSLTYSGDGGPPTSAGVFPLGVALGPTGDIFILDQLNGRVRKISGGVITTVAGNGHGNPIGPGPDGVAATSAPLDHPSGIVVDPGGNLYIVEGNAASNGKIRIRKVSGGMIGTVASGYTASPAISSDRDGTVYVALDGQIKTLAGKVVAGTGTKGFSGDGGPALAAMLNQPRGMAFGPQGEAYVADSGNNRIRILSTDITHFPFGSFDTPVDLVSGVTGAIPVTGWALDLSAVSRVSIWREPVGSEPVSANGLIFIGDATLVTGARPDVQAAFPDLPNNKRAGWGYMLLTNLLPGSTGCLGDGTYRLHAIVTNDVGNSKELGARTIVVDNSHGTKPFGTIDTPDQSGVAISGTYLNFGWALTTKPQCVPKDGSTVTVNVDGVTVGRPTYNQNRTDISSLFSGFCNSSGAVGFFYLDTTKLSNGVHTLSWVVYDDMGRGDGIGSRYFAVQNGGVAAPADNDPIEIPAEAVFRGPGRMTSEHRDEYTVIAEQLDRFEVHIGAISGWALVAGNREPLPIGSTLKGGVFYWQLGPGFLGRHELEFLRTDGRRIRVSVDIQPKADGFRQRSDR
jgi:sugar lactone lactonase YvrE